MMNEELLKRAGDLAARCARTGSVTATTFLTPTEQYALRSFRPRADCAVIFHGGVPGAERACAFFLPDWMEAADFDPGETLRCVRVTAHFSAPGHRDYLGALPAMGVRVGDASLNYVECLRPDAEVRPGDIIGLRRYGKAAVQDIGGQSRKGRIFVGGEVYI